MATATATVTQARYPHSFHLDEAGNRIVTENMRIGSYQTKSDMFRDAVQRLNKDLKETTA